VVHFQFLHRPEGSREDKWFMCICKLAPGTTRVTELSVVEQKIGDRDEKKDIVHVKLQLDAGVSGTDKRKRSPSPRQRDLYEKAKRAREGSAGAAPAAEDAGMWARDPDSDEAADHGGVAGSVQGMSDKQRGNLPEGVTPAAPSSRAGELPAQIHSTLEELEKQWAANPALSATQEGAGPGPGAIALLERLKPTTLVHVPSDYMAEIEQACAYVDNVLSGGRGSTPVPTLREVLTDPARLEQYVRQADREESESMGHNVATGVPPGVIDILHHLRDGCPRSNDPALALRSEIRQKLDELQAALNADPAKTQQAKNAGPSLKELCDKVSGTPLDFGGGKPRLFALAYFDACRARQGVTLEAALADLCTYQKYAQAATELRENYGSHFRALRGTCFPDTPARQAVQAQIDIDKMTDKGTRELFLSIGTDIDLYLATRGLHFADVCRRDGADDAENAKRTKRFLQMRDAMLANAPDNLKLRVTLNRFRVQLHALAQNKHLETLIEQAKYQNGDAVPEGTKRNWRIIAPVLAEVLAEQGVDVNKFVDAVRAVDEPNLTAAQKLANFQQTEKPFENSDLNYTNLIEQGVAKSAFEGLLLHIINNPGMAKILVSGS
jgi:hypothetical protein